MGATSFAVDNAEMFPQYPGMSEIDQFLALVGAYCVARGISERRLSTILLGAGHRIPSIRSGADIGTRRRETALQWLSDHWPAGAAWPDDIARPLPSDGASLPAPSSPAAPSETASGAAGTETEMARHD